MAQFSICNIAGLYVPCIQSHFQVCLRHVGEYLGLKVPGLAEGRPSVLLGDKVILTDPGDPDGPCYEGYVHEVCLYC